MTIADNEGAVVVGVGPHGLTSATVAVAVDAADRLGLDIELLHAVPTLVGWSTGTVESGLVLEQLTAAGRAALDQALEQVREAMQGRQAVSAELVHGGVVDGLIGRSRTARLVVLERHEHSRWEWALLGQTIGAVAARAHAPVVVVPADWRPPRRPRPIVVACEDQERAPAELWTALGLAAAEDLPVKVVRVAYLPEAYQEILRREVKEQDFLDGARADLVRDAAVPAEVCEGVPCEFEAVWGRPADVLVKLSSQASMLVLGRRDPRLPFGSHLGPVVRHVLRHSECPVMVVEPSLAEDPLGVSAERPSYAAVRG